MQQIKNVYLRKWVCFYILEVWISRLLFEIEFPMSGKRGDTISHKMMGPTKNLSSLRYCCKDWFIGEKNFYENEIFQEGRVWFGSYRKPYFMKLKSISYKKGANIYELHEIRRILPFFFQLLGRAEFCKFRATLKY